MSSPTRVLVVDDDKVDRMAIARVLSQAPESFAVVHASSAEEADARLDDGVDCILLDHSLPGRSGLEHLRLLRATHPELPVVMLTGQGDEEIAVAALKLGALDYLVKHGGTLRRLPMAIRNAIAHAETKRRAEVAEASLRETVRLLQRAVRARDSVLAIVSHDLRAPLNNVALAASLLKGEPDADDIPFAVRRIERAVARARRLIDDLLDVSALESGGMTMTTRSIAPAELVDAARGDWLAQADAAGLTVEIDVAPQLESVVADIDRIRQVLENLVGNAIKFSPSGGRIRISAQRRDGDAARPEVEFSVADDGPGIDADDLEHVFERFWHAAKRRGEGSGLGLAIARMIIEAHGGVITVESAPGRGARFSFTLPRSGPEETRKAGAATSV
ncbi:MAG: HAMP domain-containing sensor histidine kinase [Nannocystaceae bacterium]